MRRLVDLHTHSTCSDGQYEPAEVVRLAERTRLAAVALTDHDTLAGIPEARRTACELDELRFVAGIEVSAKFPNGTLHILGLGIDEQAPSIVRLARRLREARNARNPRMIRRLQDMGVRVSLDDVRLVAGAEDSDENRIVGRLHMAETLRRKGFVATTREAFDRYVGRDAPAYVDKEKMDPAETISAIREAGGAAVLAHPVQLGVADNELEPLVRSFMDAGLNGIEAYHSDHNPSQVRSYLELADRLGLFVSGGSDFHGSAKPHAALGRPRVPLSMVEPMLTSLGC
ncbi:MAG: PHP domain-containing protein [Phycisphaerae bacterium]